MRRRFGEAKVNTTVFSSFPKQAGRFMLLPNDGDEVVHRHTTNAAVRSRISRRQNERVVARSDGSVNVDGRSRFFRSLDERERFAGRTDGLVTVLIHDHCGEIAYENYSR